MLHMHTSTILSAFPEAEADFLAALAPVPEPTNRCAYALPLLLPILQGLFNRKKAAIVARDPALWEEILRDEERLLMELCKA